MTAPTVVEICAGGGGQALGLEAAGFKHTALIELEETACQTLRQNRPGWPVINADVREADGGKFTGVDLLAGGVPCQPYTIAGEGLGEDDARDLFPHAIRLTRQAWPKAIMLENVPGLATLKFAGWRAHIRRQLEDMGYHVTWRTVQAADFGLAQLRPRLVLIAIRSDAGGEVAWPLPQGRPPTVGQAIGDLMGAGGWTGASFWADIMANHIGPTLVGGSRKHGGPDLGPTRARRAWAELGVEARSLADAPPGPGGPPGGRPRLTLQMCARLQGFPDEWEFAGGKTAAYRQIGNAFPPPVAAALGSAIRQALEAGERRTAA
jgi:DNA (cytosine-5)-methyltransferase 1